MSVTQQDYLPQAKTMTVADDEFASVSEGRIRIRIGACIFLFVLVLVVLRLAELSLFGEKRGANLLPKEITTTRADITDRNGEVLATTLNTYSLYAEPRKVWNAEETARKLVSIRPDLDLNVLRSRLSAERAFVWIERGLTPKERQSVFALGMPGLAFRQEPKRVYPRGHLASHSVGFADVDLNGSAGAERAFNGILSEENAPAFALSLDMRVQYAVADELQKGLEKFEALSNAAVVMNIKTGEIISMASLPNFDPNDPGATLPETRFNHASMSTYDLGSVFKPLTMAMALEDGASNLTEIYPVQKPFKVRNKFIRDDHPSKVPLAMPEILAESSNRGTAMIALKIGAEQQQKYLKELGLMDRVPFELAESAKPQIQNRWIDLTTVTVSYGHGISVSPLALAAAIGATLNDGLYVTPTLIKRDAAHPIESRRVFSSKTSQTTRDMMRYVVTHGTGKKARVKGYGVMGKTGTAEKPAVGGYDQKRLVTSFVAAFPYEDPTYVVMITYDEPKATEGTYGWATAGWNAAPTAGAVIERIAPMLGVQRTIDPIAMSPFSEEALP
ncbi:penicillin-binding protein 2 [Hellea sp.]|nr:penicillin-binding protein 2 [Hellea sp.]